MGGKHHGREEKGKAAMKMSIADLPLNRKLALLVGMLGLIAALVGNPYSGYSVNLDAKELAVIVEKEVDHVSPPELADWIIQGKSDYRLLDLRSAGEFSQYHIPTAENVPLTRLLDYGLGRNEKTILYSGGGIHSAQGWFLLRAEGYKGVYILRGGLDEWIDQVLYPALPSDSDAAQTSAFEKMKEVSRFFGGAPRAAGQMPSQVAAPALPRVEMPAGAPVPAAPARKKREGC